MEGYEKCLQEKRSHHHACKNPSFSSTLLDAIYRSIDHEQGLDHHHHHHDQGFAVYDEEEEHQRRQLFFYQQTTRKKQSSRAHHHHDACMQSCRIDQWLEKKSADEKPTTLRWSDFQDGFPKPTKDHHPTFFNSTSTSSDSSCGGGFSSSETESIYGRRHSSSSAYSRHHPKPISTATHNKPQQIPHIYIPPPSSAASNEQKKKTSKQDGFIKTKSRTASKIYNELKKARQPISPGGRLASFLNSIFAAAGHAKKAKILSSSSSSIDCPNELGYDRKSKSAQASICSSASSFSRSCLSKTPSSRGGKPINGGGAKRSVRFLIVDEDGRPCGGGNDDLKIRLVENNKRVEEAAKEMLKEYQLKKRERLEEVIRAVHHSNQVVDDDDEEDDDDDDAGSCSSSDLFELENLTAIGMERYREELPVYETTHLGTNRAIANGLIL